MRFLPLLTLFFILIAPITQAANLLFKSNFGDGVALGSIENFYSNGKGAQQPIIGTDKETGFSWPIKAFGASSSVIQYITIDPITAGTIDDYISTKIRAVAGPDGKIVNELFQNVKIKGPPGDSGSQSPFVINRRTDIGDVTTAYITYWFRYPADLASKLDSNVPSGNWRTQFEFKTGGYDGLAYSSIGDYRVIINILKDKDGQLYWLTKGDSANAPLPKIDYWREENRIVPVPVGKWFKFEVHWNRSNDSDGRFWAAIDGQEIVDYYGPNMGEYNLPINRIMIHNTYSGGYANVEARITGLEIWDSFPCAIGISCFRN